MLSEKDFQEETAPEDARLQQAKLHKYCRDSATVTPCRGDGKESTFVPLAFSGRYLTQRTGGRADHPEMVLFSLVDAYNFATTKSIVICQFGKNVQ